MNKKDFSLFIFPNGISERLQVYGKRKIYLRLRGGLGNQLFIYFAGVYFAQKLNMSLVIDTRGVDHGRSIRDLNLPGKFIRNRFFWKIVGVVHAKTSVGELEPHSIDLVCGFQNENFILSGFFQDQFYFTQLKKLGVTTRSINISLKIYDYKPEDSALIHIRGGDYLAHSEEIGCLDPEYYKKVFSIIRAHSIQRVYILTDDEEHARRLMAECQFTNFEFIESSYMTNLELLSCFGQFNYIFLANSTLSWWGAILSKSNTKVFAPNVWYKGDKAKSNLLHQMDWITIDTSW